MKKLRMLIGCEESGIVRDAFWNRGHDVYSCDIMPSRQPSPYHIEGDLLDVMRDWKWDLMIAHPPCTYLSVSGLHWNKRRPEREQLTKEAVMFFLECWECNIPKICIENPVGCMSTILRKPDQIIQPYQFGEDASKKTCLWLKGLPMLTIDPDRRLPGRSVNHPVTGERLERWSNQTDSGQNRLGPSADRAKIRSTTYPAIAKCMAEQWSDNLLAK